MALPAVDATERSLLEERINRLWQACGCGEAAVAMCVLIVLWFAGLHPIDAWRQQASGFAAGLACIGFVAVGVTLVKITAITVAHRRLARLLERESVAIDA